MGKMMNTQNFHLGVTFDLDFTAYGRDGKLVDEFEGIFPQLWSLFARYPNWRATWFLRLDRQMEELWGSPDYIFRRYAQELQRLKQAGHEIAWHPHCYLKSQKKWIQNTDVPSIIEELKQYLPLVRQENLQVVRMGWGFQSNEIMNFFSEAGFIVDSSAIPRPCYDWETSIKDWTNTPLHPYYPSQIDYRVSGKSNLSILEIPISVASIAAPYDKQEVVRYFNLAYYPQFLSSSLQNWINSHNYLVTITHPYELIPDNDIHSLLSFDINVFEKNLLHIEYLIKNTNKNILYLKISDFKNFPCIK